jgi:hypothetical protein
VRTRAYATSRAVGRASVDRVSEVEAHAGRLELRAQPRQDAVQRSVPMCARASHAIASGAPHATSARAIGSSSSCCVRV